MPLLRALWLVAGLAGACVAARASDDLPAIWPETFGLADAALPGTGARLRECLGGDPAASPSDDRLAADIAEARFRNRMTAIESANGRATVVAMRGLWTCVRLTARGFPIWPLEALRERMTGDGASAAGQRAFQEALLREVAREGLARGLMSYANGNATEVSVLSHAKQAQDIRVSTRFLKAGSFQAADYPIRLEEPINKISSRDRNTAKPDDWRFLLPLAALDLPVEGEYAVVQPTRFTEASKLAGSRWTYAAAGTSLSLLDGGIATQASSSNTQTGTWQVVDGVLRIALHNGVRYSLTLTADLLTLEGMLRRTLNGSSGPQEFQSVQRFSRDS